MSDFLNPMYANYSDLDLYLNLFITQFHQLLKTPLDLPIERFCVSILKGRHIISNRLTDISPTYSCLLLHDVFTPFLTRLTITQHGLYPTIIPYLFLPLYFLFCISRFYIFLGLGVHYDTLYANVYRWMCVAYM